jgi:mRNA-degrading endonuclease RelE of RelBE toxin-antitoxin system
MATKTAGGFALGNYRAIYAIDDGRKSVDITRIAHRKDAYD